METAPRARSPADGVMRVTLAAVAARLLNGMTASTTPSATPAMSGRLMDVPFSKVGGGAGVARAAGRLVVRGRGLGGDDVDRDAGGRRLAAVVVGDAHGQGAVVCVTRVVVGVGVAGLGVTGRDVVLLGEAPVGQALERLVACLGDGDGPGGRQAAGAGVDDEGGFAVDAGSHVVALVGAEIERAGLTAVDGDVDAACADPAGCGGVVAERRIGGAPDEERGCRPEDERSGGDTTEQGP